MRLIIIEDCTSEDIASVLQQPIKGRVLSDIIESQTEEISNPSYESDYHGDDITVCGYDKVEQWAGILQDTEPDEPPVSMPTPAGSERHTMVPKPSSSISTGELVPDFGTTEPVGHTRAWKDIENEVVSYCTSWREAVEAYKEAFPMSLRKDHAVEMRWYHLRKAGKLKTQEVKPPAPDTAPHIPKGAPNPPTDAPDVLNEEVINHLMNARCQADIPAEGGKTKYVQGYIRRVLIDRNVLIECDAGAMCWCTLDCVVLLEDRP